MPTVQIPARRLRENYIRCEADLRRVYREQLSAHGFDLALPFAVQRTDDELVITQEIPGRLGNNHPQVWPRLQRIVRADATAIPELAAVLMAEGDDRWQTLASLEVPLPEQGGDYYADTGTSGDGHSDQMITPEQLAGRLMCGKVLLLFGLRNEAL